MTPPNEHTSEGGRDDRGVPYHAESTLSSAQVLKCLRNREVAKTNGRYIFDSSYNFFVPHRALG